MIIRNAAQRTRRSRGNLRPCRLAFPLPPLCSLCSFAAKNGFAEEGIAAKEHKEHIEEAGSLHRVDARCLRCLLCALCALSRPRMGSQKRGSPRKSTRNTQKKRNGSTASTRVVSAASFVLYVLFRGQEWVRRGGDSRERAQRTHRRSRKSPPCRRPLSLLPPLCSMCSFAAKNGFAEEGIAAKKAQRTQRPRLRRVPSRSPVSSLASC